MLSMDIAMVCILPQLTGSCAPTDVWELELHAEVALDCGGEGGPDEGGQEGGQEGGD